MSEKNPLYLHGKLVDKIERQDELIEGLLGILHDAKIELSFKSQLQELRAFISADCDRLYAALNQEFSPLHQFNELSRENANKYLRLAQELVPESPERMRRDG